MQPPLPRIAPTVYQPPRLTPLGPWTAVTLALSIPIGPGSALGPVTTPGGQP